MLLFRMQNRRPGGSTGLRTKLERNVAGLEGKIEERLDRFWKSVEERVGIVRGRLRMLGHLVVMGIAGMVACEYHSVMKVVGSK